MNSDEQKDPADLELEQVVHSIRSVGEDENGDAPGEQNPNPPLPDWGSDGVPADDEPAR
jgi:hypothetical protein